MTSPGGAAAPFVLGEREFVVLLAAVSALQALAIDGMLPALGVMARDLGATGENQRQLVIALFLFGLGIGALLPGTLSDRFGRKPVLLGCLAGYVVPSIACAFVGDMESLLVLRVMQAVGGSGLLVIPNAIIRDRFEGDRMARLQSLVSFIFMIVPVLAPLLGQAVMDALGWRWIFGLLGACGLAVTVWVQVRLPETLRPAFRQPIHPRAMWGNIAAILRRRESAGYVLASTLMISSIWGYLNSAQQLIADRFGAGDRFPYVFGFMVMFMSLANLANARIVERFGARRVSQSALLVFLAAAAVQLWLASRPHQTLWQFVPVMAVNLGLTGFMSANFGAIALQPFARAAGAASSSLTFIRSTLGAILAIGIGQAYDGTARPLAMALVVAGGLGLVLVLHAERGRLFRRVYPRGAPRPSG